MSTVSWKGSPWRGELRRPQARKLGNVRAHAPHGHLFRSFHQTSQFSFGGVDWSEELAEDGFIVPKPAPPLISEQADSSKEFPLEFRLRLLHDGQVLGVELHPSRIEFTVHDIEFETGLGEACEAETAKPPVTFWPVQVTFDEVIAWRFFKDAVIDQKVGQLRVLNHSIRGNLKRLDEFHAACVRRSATGSWLIFLLMLSNPCRGTRLWDPVSRSGFTMSEDAILAIECRAVTICSDHETVWAKVRGNLDAGLVEEAYLQRETRFGVKRLDWPAT